MNGIIYHPELIQGTDEWLAARCGLLTASEMHLILTPETKKSAKSDKSRQHLYELLAQRVTKYVEPHYVNDAMLRGQQDEIFARSMYSEKIAPVMETGFVTNDEWGFTIGYSPDGLVGDDGLIECKSRGQAHQMMTLVECMPQKAVPKEYMLQMQTGLLVTKRKWCDFITYCGGLHMAVVRVLPDAVTHAAIIEAAREFEDQLVEKLHIYRRLVASNPLIFETERHIVQEMFV